MSHNSLLIECKSKFCKELDTSLLLLFLLISLSPFLLCSNLGYYYQDSLESDIFDLCSYHKCSSQHLNNEDNLSYISCSLLKNSLSRKYYSSIRQGRGIKSLLLFHQLAGLFLRYNFVSANTLEYHKNIYQ